MVAAPEDRGLPRLERRPHATAYQVDDLMHLVRTGQVRMPPFQRKLKWGPRDRVDLFDSIYRGFPIGTLLLWKRSAPAGEVRFDQFVANVADRADALFLVDGQQRV